MTLHPEYIIDEKGNRRKVLLSIEEFQERVECAQDVLDADLIDEVKREPGIAWRGENKTGASG